MTTDFTATRDAICEAIADILDTPSIEALEECVRYAPEDAVDDGGRHRASETMDRLRELAEAATERRLPECASCHEPSVEVDPSGEPVCADHWVDAIGRSMAGEHEDPSDPTEASGGAS